MNKQQELDNKRKKTESWLIKILLLKKKRKRRPSYLILAYNSQKNLQKNQ